MILTSFSESIVWGSSRGALVEEPSFSLSSFSGEPGRGVKRALCHLVHLSLWLHNLHKQGPGSPVKQHTQALTAHSERRICKGMATQ